MNTPTPAAPSAVELGLFKPGEPLPEQRMALHPVDVRLMTQAAEREHLSLGDFVVLAAYLRAKQVLEGTHSSAPEWTPQLGLCPRANGCADRLATPGAFAGPPRTQPLPPIKKR